MAVTELVAKDHTIDVMGSNRIPVYVLNIGQIYAGGG